MVFFYLFRIKENAGNIYSRVLEWANHAEQKNPKGDVFQDSHFESNKIHSRRLWRLPGLKYATYPGIKEGFSVLKTDLVTQEIDRQQFISNRASNEWGAKAILERILLHWDTETGVFGIKDNTFHEDKIRYKSIDGAMAHVSLLNMAWNCLSAPMFDEYWSGEPMNYRIQFWKDNPEYNPFSGNN
jgi:hypothetical protein